MMQLPKFHFQDLAFKALASVAAYLVLQLIRYIINRCHQHKTFERMKVPHLRPRSLTSGHFKELLRENIMSFMERLHKTCGNTGGFYVGGEPFIATADPELIQEVFVEKSHIFHDRRPARLEVEPLPQSIFILKGERWRYVRNLLTPAFASSKIKSDQFYRDTLKTVEKFISQLERNSELNGEKTRETFVEDLYDRMAACTIDVIVKSVFQLHDSVSFQGPLRGVKKKQTSLLVGWTEWLLGALGKRTELKGDSFLDASKRTVNMMINPAVVFTYSFPALEKPLTFLCNHLYMGPLIDLFFTRINKLAQQATREREKGIEGQRRRIIDTLLDVFREGKLTLNEMKGNALVMVFAGFETTANALTFTLWLLAKHERVQIKLRKELFALMNETVDTCRENAVKSAKELTQAELGELVAGCEYLESVINESLRLYPPAPAITFRQANADCVLSNGMQVERGVSFVASVFRIHRDESLWGRDAHLFRPERFELLDANQLKSNMFMPFGIGQRICIGRTLAQQEMKMIIARLMLDYSVECWAGKTPEELNLTSHTSVSMAIVDKVALKFKKLSRE